MTTTCVPAAANIDDRPGTAPAPARPCITVLARRRMARQRPARDRGLPTTDVLMTGGPAA
jgi:hypothetical protein